MVNYFETLNISPNAEAEVIRSAYKALAKKYHPDNSDLPTEISEQKMILINEAYRILSDERLKEQHLKELGYAAQNSSYEQKVKFEKEEKCTSNTECRENVSLENDSGDITYIIIIFIIVISVVCCAIYFVPGLIKEAWKNLYQEIEGILDTF